MCAMWPMSIRKKTTRGPRANSMQNPMCAPAHYPIVPIVDVLSNTIRVRGSFESGMQSAWTIAVLLFTASAATAVAREGPVAATTVVDADAMATSTTTVVAAAVSVLVEGAATVPCARSCRSHTCGALNASFTCEELSRFSCSCSGCCRHPHSPPPPPPPPPSPPPSPECLAPCRQLTCGVLSAALTCSELSGIGCTCVGCCLNSTATQMQPAPHRTTLRLARVAARRRGSSAQQSPPPPPAASPPPAFDRRFCCYSPLHPRSYCKVREHAVCQHVDCGAARPPCRRFCMLTSCDGCPGPNPGEVSTHVRQACIARRVPFEPVCSDALSYPSPCLAEAMCFAPPSAMALRSASAASAHASINESTSPHASPSSHGMLAPWPAPEVAWRHMGSSGSCFLAD